MLTNLHNHPPQAMAVAMALAAGSAHPLSQAIVRAGAAAGLEPAQISALQERPGYGTMGQWQGQTVRLGRAAWVGVQAGAQTSAWLQIGTGAPLQLTFADTLRAGAAQAVAELKQQGCNVIMISGDAAPAVAALAAELGITDWHAEALPAEKLARIEALSAAGHKVLMVGDGLNDTAALSAAHASISPASALDAARVASDIVLLGGDLAPIAQAVQTAQAATRRIRENFTVATVYNIVAVPLAVAGLCSPLIAALAMSLSSITVSLNALRLR